MFSVHKENILEHSMYFAWGLLGFSIGTMSITGLLVTLGLAFVLFMIED